MEEIWDGISRCQLHLKFDDYTEGDGNCFPRAVVQQCRRPEIQNNLNQNQKINTQHYMAVRSAVCNFMVNSHNPSIQQFRQSYIDNEWATSRVGWNDYWIAMSQDKVWVDYKFIQGTAWYLKQDIMIVTTGSTPLNPYIYINGDMNNNNIPCPGVPILIGSLLDQHFQSLLPAEFVPALNTNLEINEDNFPTLLGSSKPVTINKKKIEKKKYIGKKSGNFRNKGFQENSKLAFNVEQEDRKKLEVHEKENNHKEQTQKQEIEKENPVGDHKKNRLGNQKREKSTCSACKKCVLNLMLHLKRSLTCQTQHDIADSEQNKRKKDKIKNSQWMKNWRNRKLPENEDLCRELEKA